MFTTKDIYCYRGGKAPFQQLKDGEYWCSWCGQPFRPDDAAKYRADDEERQRIRVERERNWQRELESEERRDRASRNAWVHCHPGMKVVALCDLEYGVVDWSNAMNWHHNDQTRPENVFIPKGSTGKVCSLEATLGLVGIR